MGAARPQTPRSLSEESRHAKTFYIMKYTKDRLTEDYYRELTALLRELKDPRIDPMLSIVHIDLTNDLSYCKVYVSSLGGLEKAKESVKGLKSAAGYLRRELFKRFKLHKSPELIFIADNSIEYGAGIDKKIEDLKREEEEKNKNHDE